MSRLILTAAVLTALATTTARAESLIPPTYYSRLLLVNNQHAQHRAWLQGQLRQQQLMQMQLRRAGRGLPPTQAMLEQQRRLQLQNIAYQQMMQGTARALRQNREAEFWWNVNHSRWPYPW